MKINYYLSLIPEALVASMLDPAQFGLYYALGSHQRSMGQAMFFQINPDLAGEALPVAEAERRCVPHADGRPKNSAYLKIYRALESIPLRALEKLHLTTHDGKTLTLEPGTFNPYGSAPWHLYQEICPVHPRVASRLDPLAFGRELTDPTRPTSVPRLVYAEMNLDELAFDPDAPEVNNLPYPNLPHLRDCLRQLRDTGAKNHKTVIRGLREEVLFRTVRHGFFVCDQEDFLYFPMPAREQLEGEFYPWWRSAQAGFGG